MLLHYGFSDVHGTNMLSDQVKENIIWLQTIKLKCIFNLKCSFSSKINVESLGSKMRTLSREKVLVRAKPQPCSKALRIIAALVVGGALARPNGFRNLIPHTSTLMSTVSMGE